MHFLRKRRTDLRHRIQHGDLHPKDGKAESGSFKGIVRRSETDELHEPQVQQ